MFVFWTLKHSAAMYLQFKSKCWQEAKYFALSRPKMKKGLWNVLRLVSCVLTINLKHFIEASGILCSNWNPNPVFSIVSAGKQRYCREVDTKSWTLASIFMISTSHQAEFWDKILLHGKWLGKCLQSAENNKWVMLQKENHSQRVNTKMVSKSGLHGYNYIYSTQYPKLIRLLHCEWPENVSSFDDER